MAALDHFFDLDWSHHPAMPDFAFGVEFIMMGAVFTAGGLSLGYFFAVPTQKSFLATPYTKVFQVSGVAAVGTQGVPDRGLKFLVHGDSVIKNETFPLKFLVGIFLQVFEDAPF